MLTKIEFSPAVIDPSIYLAAMANPAHGAQDVFIGKVRVNNLNRQVVGIDYEIFAELAAKVLSDLCSEARQQIEPSLDFTVVHREGFVAVGEISVLIIASSPHRDESFRACRYLIEEIKHRVPIWKQEHYVDGKSEWVQGHALCQHG